MKTKKCVIYDRQTKKNKSQVSMLQEIANSNNLEVADVFNDTVSARAYRPGFEQMLKVVSKGKANTIVCLRLDRLSRDASTTAKLTSLIGEKNIQIITPTQSFDNSNIFEFLLSLGLAFSIRANHSKSVRRGMKANHYCK